MSDPAVRLLRLLSLLQMRPVWSGPDLADRLDTTTRTIRRDVERLRSLGYPVDAAPGPTGGYRLGHGGRLPPLLLDDDEAAAVALSLGSAADAAVPAVGELALAALSKLDRVFPEHLRHRVAALRAATVHVGGSTAEHVEIATLVALAQACAEHVRVRLDYLDREGRRTERRVEPHRLVRAGRRWYLVAHDVDRRAWRTFRVDRIDGVGVTGHRFAPPADPPDAAALVSDAVSTAPYRITARVRLHAPLDEVRRMVPATVAQLDADGQEHTMLTTGADDVRTIAGHLVMLGFDLEVLEPPELAAELEAIARRLDRSISRPVRRR